MRGLGRPVDRGHPRVDRQVAQLAVDERGRPGHARVMRSLVWDAATAAPLFRLADGAVWLNGMDVSPDGRSLAFSLLGDIYTMPIAGGKAVSRSFKPLFDRVVIKRMEEEKLSAGGIVIPDSAKEKSTKGEVVAIGAGSVPIGGPEWNSRVYVLDRRLQPVPPPPPKPPWPPPPPPPPEPLVP